MVHLHFAHSAFSVAFITLMEYMRGTILSKSTDGSHKLKGFTIKGNVNLEAEKYFCGIVNSQTSRILDRKFW